MEKFAAGLMLGAVAGALVVTNSYKMRSLVKKSQDELKMKFDDMIDEKIQMMETATTQKTAEEKTDKKKKA
ncbi:MAG: hypothetical protein IKC37_04310 [Clostridia bacterium]|nr:hypothetical protein [Clostridia bacterium]